jgi:hypothetical protein
MIDRRHKLSVSRQASLLGISRGAVYYLPKPIGESDLRIMHAMIGFIWIFPSWVRASLPEHFGNKAIVWVGFTCARS